MKKSNIYTFLICVFVFSFSISVSAHPGRTDSNGGHYNRKTGEYHYHNGSSAGRNTGGSSGDYTYSHFAGPTTDYNSNSDSANSITKATEGITETTEGITYPYENSINTTEHTTNTTQAENTAKTLNYVLFACSIIIAGTITFFISKKIFIKRKSNKFANELKENLISIANRNSKIEQQIIESLKEKISEIKIREKKIDETYESIRTTKPKEYYEYILSKDSIENLSRFPSGIKNYNGFLFDTESDEPYGRFTLYISPEDATIHIKKGCDGAFVCQHLLYNNLINIPICSKCAEQTEKYYKDKINFMNSVALSYERYKNYHNFIV